MSRVERLEDRLLLAADPFQPSHELGKALESIADVNLGLTPPGQMNQLDFSVTAVAYGLTRSDSDTAQVTGNMVVTLGIDFDAATHGVTGVEELEFTGGRIYLSDVSITLDYGLLLGKVEASGTGISGTMDTPSPPGTVTGREFSTAEHLVILDDGLFHAYGTGSIGNLFDPVTINLSDEPIEATTEMTGYLDVSLRTVVHDTATYDATLTLPVDFDEEVYNEGGVVVTVTVAGTLEATGQFTRTVPYYGAIRGSKWNDRDGDGRWDDGEPGLPDWKIYLDENRDGDWDSGERYDMTDANGDYEFTDLVPGTYTVAEVPQPDWEQTFPAGGTHQVVVGPGQVVTEICFGNRARPEVVARHVFYNGSFFDGGDPAASDNDDHAIASDKQALRPGETASFANYTSYSRGINGILIDVRNLPEGITLDADDFQFKIGNSATPDAWADALDPMSVSVRPGEGEGHSDRVTLIWSENAIQKQWLQVTVPAGGDIGLPEADVFYFGNAIGESGNSAGDAKVNAYDMLGARDNQRTFVNPAPIAFPYDYNRDARVNAYDMLIARDNQTHFLNALKLITVPAGKAAGQNAAGVGRGVVHDAVLAEAVGGESGRPAARWANLDWMYEFESGGTKDRPTGKQKSVEATPDKWLVVGGP